MGGRGRAAEQCLNRGRRGFWEPIGFALAAAIALSVSVEPRPGLSAVGPNSTFSTTTSTTSASTFTVYGPGGNFLSNPSVLAALQKLSAGGLAAATLNHTDLSLSTTTTFGPATILIGPDQSVPFFVVPGTTNVNTNTHTHFFWDVNLTGANPAAGWVFGDFHAAFQSALLDHNWSFLDALFQQLRGFGANGLGPGASLPMGGQLAALGAADGPVMLAQRGPDGRMRPSPWFVWLRPHGTLGTVNSSDERLGFRYDVAGVSAGVEHRWPGPWLGGATLGYAHASLTQATTGDKGHVESLQIGAYGGYRGERLHVIAAALFAQNWISSERFTVLSPALASASYSGQAYSVGIEAGHKYPVWQAWVQPLASLVFTHLRQGAFRESGTTLLELAGDAQSVNALRLSLGVRAWRDFEVFGAKFTPEIRARWMQDLLNERRAITARFVGDAAQTAFTVNGAKPTPAAVIIGAGVTLRAGHAFKLAIGYDAELRANARSHTIQAALKLRW
jgi:outer membrane autotransporter protein